MPSIKTLFLALFLVLLALLIVVFFAKKSHLVPDAEIYAKQNPNCSTIKVHSNKNSLVECFLNFESLEDLPENPQGVDTLYVPMARFIGERFPSEFPIRVRHIFSIPDELTDSIGIHGNSISVAKGKNSHWHNKINGCRFPGPCPVTPLQIGNSVNAILPGRVLKIEQDSALSITIYHGENIYSKMSGLAKLKEGVEIGKNVSPDSSLGHIMQKTRFSLEITRNGKSEKFEKFKNSYY
ncbi:MAG: M23 family metallopeptidase [Fibromonadaceae bacterium]|jgi:hypothetical protein|nr:M23 family metallopeptidase [Fibromonadaceae bacterium]